MNKFVERFGGAVKGILTGFDRIVFKGTILPLAYPDGAMSFLGWRGVLNKEYKSWVMKQSEALIATVDSYAREQCGQGIVHLNTWRNDKDALAKERQKRTGIDSGLIGAWSCLESGRSYKAHYSTQMGYPQLHTYPTQCKHLYLYLDHAQYGLMNIRLQTWFPYHIQICMNGRHWLRRGLEASNVEFLHEGNKLFHVADYAKAQRLLDEQLDSRWPELLGEFVSIAFPTMSEVLGQHLSYYWTLWQSEWATDLVMDSPARITATMDALMKHAWFTGTSTRVLRYLDRPMTRSGRPYLVSNNQVISRVLDFNEGIRIRHWVDHNSVKLYNQQNLLRLETTMNCPGMFRVYRRAQGEPSDAPKKLRALRKGVADIPLRAQVSQEINQRCMAQLSTFSDQTPMRDLLADLTRGKTRDGRRVRALAPTGKDRELLDVIADPVFAVAGITNKALRRRLADTPWGSGRTDKQLAARITRHLRILRDHGIIRKVPNRLQYQLTQKGRQFTTSLHAMLAASTEQLMDMAA